MGLASKSPSFQMRRSTKLGMNFGAEPSFNLMSNTNRDRSKSPRFQISSKFKKYDLNVEGMDEGADVSNFN